LAISSTHRTTAGLEVVGFVIDAVNLPHPEDQSQSVGPPSPKVVRISVFVSGKRQRTAALHDANAQFGSAWKTRSVLECACPLALWYGDWTKTETRPPGEKSMREACQLAGFFHNERFQNSK
jgi:hypothetical protein